MRGSGRGVLDRSSPTSRKMIGRPIANPPDAVQALRAVTAKLTFIPKLTLLLSVELLAASGQAPHCGELVSNAGSGKHGRLESILRHIA